MADEVAAYVCGRLDSTFKDSCLRCQCRFHENICGTSVADRPGHISYYCQPCYTAVDAQLVADPDRILFDSLPQTTQRQLWHARMWVAGRFTITHKEVREYDQLLPFAIELEHELIGLGNAPTLLTLTQVRKLFADSSNRRDVTTRIRSTVAADDGQPSE